MTWYGKLLNMLQNSFGYSVEDNDPINKFGENDDVDIADVTAGKAGNQLGQVIWPVKAGTQLYQFIDTPKTVTVKSTSVNDASGGTGSFVVTFFYQDANGDMKEVDINLTGTTPVAFPETILGSFRAKIKQPGVCCSQYVLQHESNGNYCAFDGSDYLTPSEATTATAQKFIVTQSGAGYTWELADDPGSYASSLETNTRVKKGTDPTIWEGLTPGGAYARFKTALSNYSKYEELVIKLTSTTDDPINHFRLVLISGPSSINDGDITINDSTTGDIYNIIEADHGQSLIAVQKIPTGKKGKIVSHYAKFAKAVVQVQSADVELYVRKSNGSLQIKYNGQISNTKLLDEKTYKVGGIAVEAGDTVFWVCTNSSVDNVPIQAGFDITIEDV